MFENLRNAINTSSARSAWARGVKAYALDLVDELDTAPIMRSANPTT